jgi:hypothetical protein
MALTPEQVAYFKSQLGSTIDQVDLEERLLRLGTQEQAAAEAIEQMIADLLAKPASFSVPGEYSEDRSANIKALTEKAGEIRDRLPLGDQVVKVVNPVQRFGR